MINQIVYSNGKNLAGAGPTHMKKMNIKKEKQVGGDALTVIGSTSIITEEGKSTNTKMYFATDVKTYLSLNVWKKLNLVIQIFEQVNTVANNNINICIYISYCIHQP